MVQLFNMAGDYKCNYCGFITALLNKTPRSPDVPKLTYQFTDNNTIVRLKFHSIASKGYWKTNIQPALDLMKALVPASMRSYNPTTFMWEVAAEYWPAIKTTYESKVFNFICTEGSVVANPYINVPKDYADNFYRAPEPITVKESAASIAASLSVYLGVPIVAQDLSELKKLYRLKARELHPDLNHAPEAAQKMSELNRLWTLYSSGGIQ
jgi:hypothetical protein